MIQSILIHFVLKIKGILWYILTVHIVKVHSQESRFIVSVKSVKNDTKSGITTLIEMLVLSLQLQIFFVGPLSLLLAATFIFAYPAALDNGTELVILAVFFKFHFEQLFPDILLCKWFCTLVHFIVLHKISIDLMNFFFIFLSVVVDLASLLIHPQ